MQHFKGEDDYLFKSVKLEMKMYNSSVTGKKRVKGIQFVILIIVAACVCVSYHKGNVMKALFCSSTYLQIIIMVHCLNSNHFKIEKHGLLLL